MSAVIKLVTCRNSAVAARYRRGDRPSQNHRAGPAGGPPRELLARQAAVSKRNARRQSAGKDRPFGRQHGPAPITKEQPQIGGSRATAVTSDRDAARLVFQNASEPSADSVLEICLVQLSCMASISAIRACRRTITGRCGCPHVVAGLRARQSDTGAPQACQDLVTGGRGQHSHSARRPREPPASAPVRLQRPVARLATWWVGKPYESAAVNGASGRSGSGTGDGCVIEGGAGAPVAGPGTAWAMPRSSLTHLTGRR